MGSAAAEQSKTAGNAAFKSLDYPLALSHYSTAIALDPSVSTYPLNRSLVHLKLSHWNDAERDATTAIDLDGGANVKALFRRGLARKGKGKLVEAKKDFEEAIKQGAGQDAQSELAHVTKQLKGMSEKSKTIDSSTTKSQPASTPTTTQSKSDRLRAAISSSSSPKPNEPSSSAPKPSASKSSTTPIEKATEEDGFGMKAVSTRKLSKPSPPQAPPSESAQSQPTNPLPPPPSPSTVSPSPSATSPETSASTSSSSSSSFAAKKLSRQTRQTQPLIPSPSPSSTPPSNVPRSPPATPLTTPFHSLPLKSSRPSHPQSSTLTSLESSLLLSSPTSIPSRLSLLKILDPSPTTLVPFIGDSLTPDLLSLILSQLQTALETKEEVEVGWMVDLLEGLSQCKRFETSRMFLGREEIEVVGKVFERERERLERVESGWGI